MLKWRIAIDRHIVRDEMKKAIASALIIILVVAGSYFGYQKYQYEKEKTSAIEILREAASLVGRQMEMNMSNDISFAEHIKKGTISIEKTESLIDRLAGGDFKKVTSEADAIRVFVRDSQKVIRSLTSSARLQMQYEVIEKNAATYLSSIGSAKDTYSMNTAVSAAKAASKEQIDASVKVSESEALLKKNLNYLYLTDKDVKSLLGRSEGLTESNLSDIAQLKKR